MDRGGNCIDGIHEDDPYCSGSKLSKDIGVSDSDTSHTALLAQDALSVHVLCSAHGFALKLYAVGNKLCPLHPWSFASLVPGCYADAYPPCN